MLLVIISESDEVLLVAKEVKSVSQRNIIETKHICQRDIELQKGRYANKLAYHLNISSSILF